MAYSLANSSYGQSIEAFLVPDGESAVNTAGAGGGGNYNHLQVALATIASNAPFLIAFAI